MYSPADSFVNLDMASFSKSEILVLSSGALADIRRHDFLRAKNNLHIIVASKTIPRLYRICEHHDWNCLRHSHACMEEADITKAFAKKLKLQICEHVINECTDDINFINRLMRQIKKIPEEFEETLLTVLSE